MRSVYIHIPFCDEICSYCDFCKLKYNTSWADLYLDALNEEIYNYYEKDKIKSIYIGGGTPSSLNFEQLNKLFNILNQFDKSKYGEYTFETNVNNIDEKLLKIIKKNKINRISVGVQSFNDKKLTFLNRKHNKKDIINAIKLIKKYDFDNFNIDLIYALPFENLIILKKDLNEILKLNPPHISTYSLIIEKNTKLYIDNTQPLKEELDYQMYKYILNALKKKGYIHYEVSNFSLHGFESAHNMNYWDNNEYYGFGLSSHGYINGVRYENTKNFDKYIKLEYRKEELIISKKEEMENEIILGLRKLEGIDIYNFYKKFDINIQDVFNIKDPIKQGYLILDKNYLKIPKDKVYVMNEILNQILNW